ncbi:PD40 domain-containing protein [Ideonella sp. 4Y11]|uniref:PD40 domain-containing protein n=1 Tax=Ideonella aquatica TaxID=2824119 RepID=A0A941BJR6_9BURK|nr:PD40 domain-containing protein [Ideonella aquatica]MBQ0957779.1 PD40 domain-containing protein [Ideonella aquatica]
MSTALVRSVALALALPAAVQAVPLDAGIDQQVNIGTTVRLTGSALNLHNLPMTGYQWTQLSGPSVTLSSTTVPNPTFYTPSVAVDTDLHFRFQAVDGSGTTHSDEVVITVRASASNQPPVQTLGATRTVYKHAIVQTCAGGLDYDGNIVSRQWTQIKGPALKKVTMTDDQACLSYTVPGISQGKEVVYQVVATDDLGATSTDLLSLWLFPQLPAVSPQVTAGARRVLLTWPAVNKAAGYEICRALVPVTDVGQCASLGGVLTAVGKSPGWLDETVVTGTTYHYAMRAVEADGSPGRTGLSRSVLAQDNATRVILRASGGNGASVSAKGRHVVFTTPAAMVSGDANNAYDVYLYDQMQNLFTLISANPAGVAGNGLSMWGAISGDGRSVVFESGASDLVAGDTNGKSDIFVRDLRTGTTTLVTPGGNGHSRTPNISADGRWITFVSEASNLVSGDTNGAPDVFAFDRQSGLTQRISVRSGGAQSQGVPLYMTRPPSISADGQKIAFTSYASDLVDGDDNGLQDVFVHDRGTGSTVRVGTQADVPVLAGDGRTVFFASWDRSLTSVPFSSWALFSRDLITGAVAIESINADGVGSNGMSLLSATSHDGRHLVFDSYANNLIPGVGMHQQVYRRDRQTGQLSLVSQNDSGVVANSSSMEPAMARLSPGVVVFVSNGSNLDPRDTGTSPDLYVRETP